MGGKSDGFSKSLIQFFSDGWHCVPSLLFTWGQTMERLPWWLRRLPLSVCKASACDAGDSGFIPGLKDPLEKEMAAHSSTLAWKDPWMKEPGRLESMGSQRVRHD